MLKGEKAILREKRLSDAENDYSWRCDVELARLDAATPMHLSHKEFMTYYQDELRHPSKKRQRLAIDSLDGKHIGNCMYYDIDDEKRQAELGILIGDRDYWGKGYGTDAVKTLLAHIYRGTTLDRIYLNTLEWNIRAQLCFQKCGFVTCGRITKGGNEFLVMELYLSQLKPTTADAAPSDFGTSLPSTP
jgi:RimJ/RimL family protein N-acetyltransferase